MESDDSNVIRERQKLFEEHVSELWDGVFRIIHRKTFDADLASDIAQEAVCRFLSHMNKQNWSKVINFDAYIRKIARNCFFDFLRKQRTKRFLSLDDDEEGNLHKEADQALLRNGIFKGIDPDQLEQLLEEVPLQMFLHDFTPADRELVKLHWIDELSALEIAEEQGENVDSVRYRIIKIQANFRYRVGKYKKASGKTSLF